MPNENELIRRLDALEKRVADLTKEVQILKDKAKEVKTTKNK